jgi:hypothetical protein
MFHEKNSNTGKYRYWHRKYRYYTGRGIGFSIPNWKHYHPDIIKSCYSLIRARYIKREVNLHVWNNGPPIMLVIIVLDRAFRTSESESETFLEYSKEWDFFKKIEVFANFSHFLWTKNHVLKKVGRGSSHNLFSIWYFRNLHALGYLKSVTVFWSMDFWVNKSLSMMWIVKKKNWEFFLGIFLEFFYENAERSLVEQSTSNLN